MERHHQGGIKTEQIVEYDKILRGVSKDIYNYTSFLLASLFKKIARLLTWILTPSSPMPSKWAAALSMHLVISIICVHRLSSNTLPTTLVPFIHLCVSEQEYPNLSFWSYFPPFKAIFDSGLKKNNLILESPGLWAGPGKRFLSSNAQISHSIPPPFPQTKVFISSLNGVLES